MSKQLPITLSRVRVRDFIHGGLVVNDQWVCAAGGLVGGTFSNSQLLLCCGMWRLVFKRSSQYGRQDSLVQCLVQFIRMLHWAEVKYAICDYYDLL